MWTMDNTDGFTQPELDLINRVLGRLMAAGGDDLDPSNINDAINDCWTDGISEERLEAAAREWLGLA